MKTWQPIETAPKDGTYILTWYREDNLISKEKWAAPFGFCAHWCDGFRPTFGHDPEMWMPLPKPPTFKKK